MSRSFPERLKTDGNLNRLVELEEAGCTAQDMKDCFERGGITLVVQNGDLPLLRNLPELGRRALPKRVVRDFLSRPGAPVPT